ncbi:zinc-ribbon domain-containing protein [Patescibacteria group bacterium]|nr:zinc-ribbon domain-containing protein [Patescibacteria group bacterium]
MKDKEDIWLTCACGEKFLFSIRDQDFYESKGYLPPKRCKQCRILRQKEREKFGQIPSSN